MAQLRGAIDRAVAGRTPAPRRRRRSGWSRAWACDSRTTPPTLRRSTAHGRAAERAFKEFIEYRLYADLQRGWRVTMPNLEQTGLLRIGLRVADRDRRRRRPVGVGPTHRCATRQRGQREELCRIVLDEFRRELAVDVDCLTDDGFDRVKRQSRSASAGPVVDPAARAAAAARQWCPPRPARRGASRVGRPPHWPFGARTVHPRGQRTDPRRASSWTPLTRTRSSKTFSILERAGLLTTVDCRRPDRDRTTD